MQRHAKIFCTLIAGAALGGCRQNRSPVTQPISLEKTRAYVIAVNDRRHDLALPQARQEVPVPSQVAGAKIVQGTAIQKVRETPAILNAPCETPIKPNKPSPFIAAESHAPGDAMATRGPHASLSTNQTTDRTVNAPDASGSAGLSRQTMTPVGINLGEDSQIAKSIGTELRFAPRIDGFGNATATTMPSSISLSVPDPTGGAGNARENSCVDLPGTTPAAESERSGSQTLVISPPDGEKSRRQQIEQNAADLARDAAARDALNRNVMDVLVGKETASPPPPAATRPTVSLPW